MRSGLVSVIATGVVLGSLSDHLSGLDWMNDVVPLAMEGFWIDVNELEFGIRYLDSSRIGGPVELTAHLGPGGSGGVGDQVHDHLVAGERLAPPVVGDPGEEVVLHCVPFRGSRREVTDGDDEAGLVGQAPQLGLPQAATGAV